ncbi:MAG: hypothetical protein U0350_32935 [Caldilineaceae bacterium]
MMLRRLFPVILLFFLIPLIAEFLLDNLPVSMIAVILPPALMYGSDAVLIRDVVRRTGRGWPSLILLAIAYGLIFVIDRMVAIHSAMKKITIQIARYKSIPLAFAVGFWAVSSARPPLKDSDITVVDTFARGGADLTLCRSVCMLKQNICSVFDG